MTTSDVKVGDQVRIIRGSPPVLGRAVVNYPLREYTWTVEHLHKPSAYFPDPNASYVHLSCGSSYTFVPVTTIEHVVSMAPIDSKAFPYRMLELMVEAGFAAWTPAANDPLAQRSISLVGSKG